MWKTLSQDHLPHLIMFYKRYHDSDSREIYRISLSHKMKIG